MIAPAVALLALMAAPALGVQPAGASTAAVRLDVVAGDAGTYIPGRPFPVRVTVTTDRLVTGTLTVSGGGMKVSQPVEVAGGSDKQFELVVPSRAGSAQAQLAVSLSDGGSGLASASTSVNSAPDAEVVGVLPDLLLSQALPGAVPLSVDLGSARFVALSEQDLATAPGSFGPLSDIAVSADGLVRLDAPTRQALLGWVGGGGTLLIDATPGGTVAGLPAGWQPGAQQTRRPAGTGEVVLTSGAMAAGHWAGLIAPTTGGVSTVEQAPLANGVTLASELASEAGLHTPRLRWLIVFLAAYVILVGPVAFLVFTRRRRAERLWVIIPTVALVFAGAGYTIGSRSRAHIPAVQGTVVDTSVAGGVADSYIGVLSSSPGTTSFRAPPGWVLQQYTDPQLPVVGKASPFASTATPSGPVASLPLDAGQFSVVQGAGPAAVTGALSVTASATWTGAEGTVVNTTPYTLHQAAVLVGQLGTVIGSLAPGASTHWSITGSEQTVANGQQVDSELWQGQGPTNCGVPAQVLGGIVRAGPPGVVCFGPKGPIANAATIVPGASLPVWDAGPDGLSPNTREPGIAVAVGWTDQYRPPISVAGHGRPSQGHTAIVGSSPVDAGAAVNNLALRRSIVRGRLVELGPGTVANEGGSGQQLAVRWDLPTSAAGHQLSVSVPANAGPVDVWNGSSWQMFAGTSSSSSGSVVPFGSGVPTPVPFPATTLNPKVLTPSVGTTLPVLPTPATTAPAQPPPVAFPGGLGTSTPVTTITLPSSDVVNGQLFVRLGSATGTAPFDLAGLQVSVLP